MKKVTLYSGYLLPSSVFAKLDLERTDLLLELQLFIDFRTFVRNSTPKIRI